MSKSSEAVKSWRKNTKQRMINSMGGKCSLCGYNKCNDALEFHHIDPTIKEMSLGGIRANPISWEKIVEEMKKCILVCSNCHKEIHVNIITIPETYPLFDEIYADYKSAKKMMDECPICHELKNIAHIYCSLRCAGLAHTRLDWSQHDLIEMKKTMSMVAIGVKLGVSDKTISKRLKKMAPNPGTAPDKLGLTDQPVHLLGSSG